MQKVINCSCGYIVRAENDEKLVAKAQEHAKQVHQMDLTREQALAMAGLSKSSVGSLSVQSTVSVVSRATMHTLTNAGRPFY